MILRGHNSTKGQTKYKYYKLVVEDKRPPLQKRTYKKKMKHLWVPIQAENIELMKAPMLPFIFLFRVWLIA